MVSRPISKIKSWIKNPALETEQDFFAYMLFYLSLIQLVLISPCVGVMLLECASEVVIAIESGAGAEEDIFVLLEI